MKQKKAKSSLGRAGMEMAGSLTPDLEGQAATRQHDNRDNAVPEKRGKMGQTKGKPVKEPEPPTRDEGNFVC